MKDLVTIAIPTFNRESTLNKAIESVISQTYSNIEIIIGDNASSDGTPKICELYASQDRRIRYVRHSKNIGATNNFNKLLELASGKFFMWLSDDDWLDGNYIENCVDVLKNNSDYSLVCGKCLLYEDGNFLREDKITNIEFESPFDRVKKYYLTVAGNSCFYGVMYTNSLQRIGGLKNVMGGDWLLIASITCYGKIKTLEGTQVHRSTGGGSKNAASLAISYNLPSLWGKIPYTYISFVVFKHTLVSYKHLAIFDRLILALWSSLTVFGKYQLYYLLAGFIRKKIRHL